VMAKSLLHEDRAMQPPFRYGAEPAEHSPGYVLCQYDRTTENAEIRMTKRTPNPAYPDAPTRREVAAANHLPITLERPLSAKNNRSEVHYSSCWLLGISGRREEIPHARTDARKHATSSDLRPHLIEPPRC